MTNSYTYTDAFRAYRESQKKYDYFFLGVVLASLTLSIQVVELPLGQPYRILAVLPLALLLISFISGMFRQERILKFYRVEADKIKYIDRKSTFIQGLAGQPPYKSANEVWTAAEMTEEVANLDDAIDLASKHLGTDQKVTTIAYAIEKWSFIAGLAGLIIVKYYA